MQIDAVKSIRPKKKETYYKGDITKGTVRKWFFRAGNFGLSCEENLV